MFGCQQVLIDNTEILTYLEFICSEANKLINCGTYYGRQIYFKTGKIISKFDLNYEYKKNLHYQFLCAQAAQQVLLSVAETFNSFRKLKVSYSKGEISDKPKPPKYRKKGGLALITYPKQAISLVKDRVRLPLGKKVKASFGIDSFSVPMPSNLKFEDIREVRILPRNNCFYAEFVYRQQVFKPELDKERVLGIDPGVNNWLTCVSNIGKSFIIDGRKVKSQNQWYNKQIANLKTGKPQGFWNEKLATIAERRNRQMRDAINKTARYVINFCIYNRVGIIVFGWNQRNKDSINIGKKNNQEFVQIPTAKLKQRIEQLCQQYGLNFVETEESYTSRSSFLDGDILPTYDEKLREQEYKFSGKRGERRKGKLHNLGRGGYQTNAGFRINSDCNGAANILRKVATQLGLNLAKVGRAALILPRRINVFSQPSGVPENILCESPSL
jgi:IS605 OrfB family transposase